MANEMNLTLRLKVLKDGSLSILPDTEKSVGKIGEASDRSASAMDRLSKNIARVGHYAAGLAAVSFGGSMIKDAVMLADKMTLLDSRVAIATQSFNDHTSAMGALKQISLETGSGIESNITLFSRLNKAVESTGRSYQDTLGLTKTLSQAISVSGASAGEASSLMIQLSQALSSGVLRGDEFNSVMENGSRVVDALTAATGKSRGELRKMAEEGQLSAELVMQALQSQSGAIAADAAKIPLTIGMALENLNTQWMSWLDMLNRSSGATANFAASLNGVAQNIGSIANYIVIGTAALVSYHAALSTQAVLGYVAAQYQAAVSAKAAQVAALQSAASQSAAALSVAEANVALLTSNRALVAQDIAAASAALQAANSRLVQASADRAAALATANLTQATLALAAADAARAEKTAAMAALAALGQQQAGIARDLAAATTAQAGAATAAAASQASLAASTSLTTRAMAGLRSAMAFVAGINPFVAIITAIGAAATAAWLYRDKLVAIGDATATVGNYMESSWLLAKNAASDAIDGIMALFPGFQSAIDTSIQFIVNAFNSAWSLIQSGAKALFNVIVGGFVAVGTAIGTTAAGVVEVWRQGFKRIMDMASGLALGVEAAMAGDFSFSGLRDAFSRETLSLQQVARDTNAKIKESFAADYAGMAGDALSELGGKIKEGAKDLQMLDTIMASNAERAKALGQAAGGAGTVIEIAGGKAETAAKKTASAVDQLQRHYETAAAAMEKELALSGDKTRAAEMEWEVEHGKYQALDDASKVRLLNLAAELDFKAQANQQQVAADEAYKAALNDLTQQYQQLTLSARAYYETRLKGQGVPQDKIDGLMGRYDQNRALEASKKQTEANVLAMREYDKSIAGAKKGMGDLGKVSGTVLDTSLGGINELVRAFVNVSDALADNAAQFSELAQQQALNNEWQTTSAEEAAEKHARSIAYTQREAELTDDKIRLEIDGARQIAGAAAKMFDEKSAAAKAFHAIENSLAVASMAMDAKEMALSLKKTALSVAEGASKFFAQSGWVGFAGVAAMLAVMAAVGYSASGGGMSGSKTPPDMTRTTGSVLGFGEDDSESIGNVSELLKDIHAKEYAELRGINDGITRLSDGITNVVTRLFQVGGVSPMEIAPYQKQLKSIEPVGDFLLAGLFGKTTKTVTQYGIATPIVEIAQLLAGETVKAMQFDVIETKKKSWFSTSTRYETIYSPLDPSVSKTFTDVFGYMTDTMLATADALGSGLSDRVKNYIIPSMMIDLKDMNAEEQTKKLNAVFSMVMDRMAESVFGDIIGQYQQLGEGLLETAVRIASQMAVVRDALSVSGLDMGEDAMAISNALALAAGGLKEFQSQFERFYDKFFTDDEKFVRLAGNLESRLADVFDGTTIETLGGTRTAYRQLIESLDISSEMGQAGYALLLELAEQADQYYEYQEEAMERQAAIARQLAGIMADIAVEIQDYGLTDFEKNLRDVGIRFDGLRNQAIELGATLTDLETLTYAQALAEQQLRDQRRQIVDDIIRDANTQLDRRNGSDIQNALWSIQDTWYGFMRDGMMAGASFAEAMAGFKAASTLYHEAVAASKDAVTEAFKQIYAAIADRRYSLQERIAELRGADLYPMRQQRAQALLQSTVLDEQLQGFDLLQQAIEDRYANELNLISQMEDAYKRIAEYVQSLKVNQALSTLSNEGRMNEARSQFATQLAMAQAGDADALNNITGFANTYLTEARGYYASSTDYASIFDQVSQSLLGLSGGLTPEQRIEQNTAKMVAELQDISYVLDGILAQQKTQESTQLALIDAQAQAIAQAFTEAASQLFTDAYGINARLVLEIMGANLPDGAIGLMSQLLDKGSVTEYITGILELLAKGQLTQAQFVLMGDYLLDNQGLVSTLKGLFDLNRTGGIAPDTFVAIGEWLLENQGLAATLSALLNLNRAGNVLPAEFTSIGNWLIAQQGFAKVFKATIDLYRTGAVLTDEIKQIVGWATAADATSLFKTTADLVASKAITLDEAKWIVQQAAAADQNAAFTAIANLQRQGVLTLAEAQAVKSWIDQGNKSTTLSALLNLNKAGTISPAEFTSTGNWLIAQNGVNKTFTAAINLYRSGAALTSEITQIVNWSTAADATSLFATTANLFASKAITLDEAKWIVQQAAAADQSAAFTAIANLQREGVLSIAEAQVVASWVAGGNRAATLAVNATTGTVNANALALVNEPAASSATVTVNAQTGQWNATAANLAMAGLTNGSTTVTAAATLTLDNVLNNSILSYSKADVAAVYGAIANNTFNTYNALQRLLSVNKTGFATVAATLANSADWSKAGFTGSQGWKDRESNIKTMMGYAKGGISTVPAIFGEAGPEAAVPLPDGRTIPVTLSGTLSNGGGAHDEAMVAELQALRRESRDRQDKMINRLAMLEKRLQQIEYNGALAGAA